MTEADAPGPVHVARHPAWSGWAAALLTAAHTARRDSEAMVTARLEAGVLRQVARARGWAIEGRGLALLASCPPDDPLARSVPRVPDDLAGPDLLGPVHEALLDPDARRARGAHYTSPVLAHRLVCWALEGWEPPGERDGAVRSAGEGPTVVDGWSAGDARSVTDGVSVVDLAVGGGAFLLAAARWQHARGADPMTVVAGLCGADLDAGAVAVAEAALVGWALDAGADGPAPIGPHLVVGDGLVLDPQAFDGQGRDGRGFAARPRCDPAPSGAAVDDQVGREEGDGRGPLGGRVEGGPEARDGDGIGSVGSRLGRRRVDLVVGNPPFLGQLSSATARDRPGAARLRARYGAAAGGYVDAAAVFLLAACGWARPGGRVVLVQPESVLGARDAEGVRAAVRQQADLVGLWVAGTSAFAAAVDVCAPVLQVHLDPDALDGADAVEQPSANGARDPVLDRRDPPPPPNPDTSGPAGLGSEAGGPKVLGPEAAVPEVLGPGASAVAVPAPGAPREMAAGTAVRTAHGLDVDVGPLRPRPARRSWAPLLAGARGVPAVALDGASGHLGDLATATAGFRQHFYALAPHLHEATDRDIADPVAATARVPVLTTGSVDPLALLWGRRPARIAGRTWARPVVDLDAVARDAPAVAAWVRARLQPKVVVAPQTRVVEAAVDVDGRFVPGVPLVAVEPRTAGQATLWEVEPTDGGPADVQLLLWMVAAALSAPPVTAWGLRESAGTARGGDAIKLAARQVLTVPLPPDRGRWEAAARALRAGQPLVEIGPDLSAAYGVDSDHPVNDWWQARLPVETRLSL